MEKIKVSSKGQIVIPSHLRKKFGWKEGTVLNVVEENQGVFLTPEKSLKTYTVDEVAGCLGAAPLLSEEETRKRLEEEFRKNYDRH